MAEPWLVAGLGNPGESYAETRHNAGAMVVEHLAHRFDVRLKKVRLLPLRAAETRRHGAPLVLAVPSTYMNVSGPPVASFARRRRIPVERVVVCHDDIDLPFGALRLKAGGGTAGHHGVESLVQGFRSAAFHRVRLGVGRPAGRPENVDFLLGRFGKREREQVAALIEMAADAVLALVDEGLAAAQSRYNRGAAG